MNKDQLLDMIVKNEGGFSNHPNDAGGPTNMGVTQATLSAYLGRKATIDDVKALTVDQAKEIFDRNYIAGPRLDTLPDDLLPVMADASVLYGPKRAIMFLQRTLNASGFGPLDVDGVIGPMTRDAAHNAYNQGVATKEKPGKYLINAIVYERIAFCERIVANDPSQSVFLQGWKNRAQKFRVSV